MNTEEKQRLKKELMLMGYDEDSYGQQSNEELSEGEDQLTQEERFAYDKQMFAAQLK
jgi:hypothetical protein